MPNQHFNFNQILNDIPCGNHDGHGRFNPNNDERIDVHGMRASSEGVEANRFDVQATGELLRTVVSALGGLTDVDAAA